GLVGAVVLLVWASGCQTHMQSDLAARVKSYRDRSYRLNQLIGPRRLYRWTPQAKDLPQGDSKLGDYLHYLLLHSEDRTYKVKSGDSIDRILRNQLFVCSSLYPRAYKLYFWEVVRRNGLTKPYKLKPDTTKQPSTLNLPDGPHYGAFEAPITDE